METYNKSARIADRDLNRENDPNKSIDLIITCPYDKITWVSSTIARSNSDFLTGSEFC